MDFKRIKRGDLAEWRVRQWLSQGQCCKLCGQQLHIRDAVADHCHKTGKMRGVLHRGCNAWLGKTENCVRINKLQDKVEHLLSVSVVMYMKATMDEYHPSFLTEDEKRIRRNKRAKRRREKAKAK
jgi:hypothetical protein